MKKIKRQVEISFKLVYLGQTNKPKLGSATYIYEFKTHKPIDIDNTKCFIEIDVAETLAEFRQKNNLSKDQLVEWLNKNYK